MNSLEQLHHKVSSYISKYYYPVLFLLCTILTFRRYLIITTNGSLTPLLLAIQLIIYVAVLLFPIFLMLFINPYEKNGGNFLIPKIIFLICSIIILWNWYNVVFYISLCILYAVLIRKNTTIYYLLAVIISAIGVFFTSDFVFFIVISGLVILLEKVAIRQLAFLMINSLIISVYTIITYGLTIVINNETLLLAFLFAYIVTLVSTTLYGYKQVIVCGLLTVWGVFILYLYTMVPHTFSFMWFIAPIISIGYTIRKHSSTPSIEHLLTDHKKTFLISFIFLCIPVLITVFTFNSSINKETVLTYSFTYPLVQYYITWSDLGFVQRGLPGELIKLIFGFIIPVDKMIHIALFIHLISIILELLLCFCLYRMSPKNSIPSRLFIFILGGTILYPYFFTFTFRTDIILSCIALLCIFLSLKNNIGVYIIPVLSIIAMLIHPVYGFLIFSPVFIALCFRSFIDPANHKIRNTIVLFSSTLIIISLFVFFAFFSYKFAKLSVYEGAQLIETRADGWYENEFWLQYDPDTGVSNLFTYLLYADPKAHTSMFFSPNDVRISRTETLKRLVVVFPLILYYFHVFFAAAKQYRERHKRILCAILPFSILVMLPLYIWELDYGRWNLHLILSIIIAMQFPAIMGYKTNESQKKEQTYAVAAFIISEFATIITWYA